MTTARLRNTPALSTALRRSLALKTSSLSGSRAWRTAAVVWLGQHAVLALCFALGIRYGSHVRDVPTAWRILLVGWDGKDIAAVAAGGYTTARDAAFYPVYPLLEHLLAPLFAGHYALAGWVFASLCALGAFGVLWLLVQAETGSSQLADFALFFVALSPFSVFLDLAYTEPLFLLLALLTFIALRNAHWLIAGCLTALAVLTRGAGVVLFVPLVVEVWLTVRENRSWRAILTSAVMLALPFAALAGYWLFQFKVYGVPFAGSRAEMAFWTRGFDWPWYGLVQTLGVVFRHADAGFTFRAILDLLALGVTLALCAPLALGRFRRRLSLSTSLVAYVWAMLVFTLSVPLHPTDGSDAMFSQPRYLLMAFPLAVVAAAAALRANAPWRLALVTSTLMSFAILTTLYAIGIGIG